MKLYFKKLATRNSNHKLRMEEKRRKMVVDRADRFKKKKKRWEKKKICFLFERNIYLEREAERVLTLLVHSQIGTVSQTGLVSSREPGVPSGTPTGLPFRAFSGTFTVSWITNGEAVTLNGAHLGCWYNGWKFNLLRCGSSPEDILKCVDSPRGQIFVLCQIKRN